MGFTWYEKVHREEKLDPKRKKFEALRCLIEHLPQQNDNNSSYAHIVSDQHLTLEYVISKLEDEGEEYFSKGKRLTRLSYAASFHCLLDKLIAKLDGIECDDEVIQQRIANERAAAESVKTYLLEKVLSAAEDTNLTLLNSKDLEKKIDHQNKLKSRTRAWMKAMAAARAIGCGESVSDADETEAAAPHGEKRHGSESPEKPTKKRCSRSSSKLGGEIEQQGRGRSKTGGGKNRQSKSRSRSKKVEEKKQHDRSRSKAVGGKEQQNRSRSKARIEKTQRSESRSKLGSEASTKTSVAPGKSQERSTSTLNSSTGTTDENAISPGHEQVVKTVPANALARFAVRSVEDICREKKLTLVPVHPDGHCQYSAVIACLKSLGEDNGWTPVTLRKHLAEYVKTQFEDVHDHPVKTMLLQRMENDTKFCVDVLLKEIGEESGEEWSWGGDLTLALLSDFLSLSFEVYVAARNSCMVSKQPTVIQSMSKHAPTYKTAYLVLRNLHYEALVPSQQAADSSDSLQQETLALPEGTSSVSQKSAKPVVPASEERLSHSGTFSPGRTFGVRPSLKAVRAAECADKARRIVERSKKVQPPTSKSSVTDFLASFLSVPWDVPPRMMPPELPRVLRSELPPLPERRTVINIMCGPQVFEYTERNTAIFTEFEVGATRRNHSHFGKKPQWSDPMVVAHVENDELASRVLKNGARSAFLFHLHDTIYENSVLPVVIGKTVLLCAPKDAYVAVLCTTQFWCAMRVLVMEMPVTGIVANPTKYGNLVDEGIEDVLRAAGIQQVDVIAFVLDSGEVLDHYDIRLNPPTTDPDHAAIGLHGLFQHLARKHKCRVVFGGLLDAKLPPNLPDINRNRAKRARGPKYALGTTHYKAYTAFVENVHAAFMRLEDDNPTSTVQFVNCTLVTPKYANIIFGEDGRVTALYLASLSTALAHAVAAVLGDFFQMKQLYGETHYQAAYRDKVLRTSFTCDRWKWSGLDAETEQMLRKLKVLRDPEEQAMAVGHPQFDFLTPLNRHLRNNRTNPDNSPIGKSDKTTTLLGPNATIDQEKQPLPGEQHFDVLDAVRTSAGTNTLDPDATIDQEIQTLPAGELFDFNGPLNLDDLGDLGELGNFNESDLSLSGESDKDATSHVADTEHGSAEISPNNQNIALDIPVPEVAAEVILGDELFLTERCLQNTGFQRLVEKALAKDDPSKQSDVSPSHKEPIGEGVSPSANASEEIQIVNETNTRALQSMIETALAEDGPSKEPDVTPSHTEPITEHAPPPVNPSEKRPLADESNARAHLRQDLHGLVEIACAEPVEDGSPKQPNVQSSHKEQISEGAPPSVAASDEHAIGNEDNSESKIAGESDIESEEELEDGTVEAEEDDNDDDDEDEDDEYSTNDESDVEESSECDARSRHKSSTSTTSVTVKSSSERSRSTYHEVPEGQMRESGEEDEGSGPVLSLVRDADEDSDF